MMCKPALTLSRERACHAKHSTLTLSSNGRLPGWTRLPRASRTEMPHKQKNPASVQAWHAMCFLNGRVAQVANDRGPQRS